MKNGKYSAPDLTFEATLIRILPGSRINQIFSSLFN
jgi:hypothetical protein